MEFLKNPEASIINEGIGTAIKGALLSFSLKFLPEKSLDIAVSRAVSVASSKAKTQEEKDAIDKLFGDAPKNKAGKIALLKRILKYTPEPVLAQADQKIKNIAKRIAPKVNQNNKPIQKEDVEIIVKELLLNESLINADDFNDVFGNINEAPNPYAGGGGAPNIRNVGVTSGAEDGVSQFAKNLVGRTIASSAANTAIKNVGATAPSATQLAGYSRAIAPAATAAVAAAESGTGLLGTVIATIASGNFLLGIVLGIIGAAITAFIAYKVGKKVVGSARRGIYDIATRTAQGLERSQARSDALN
jgi:hypothetical protein